MKPNNNNNQKKKKKKEREKKKDYILEIHLTNEFERFKILLNNVSCPVL